MSTGSGREATNGSAGINKNQRGSIMIEFVFVVTILVAVFLAAVTFSFQFADCYGIQKVAREGAREASITRDTSWARVRAMQAAWLWGLDQDNMSVDFETSGTAVTCYATYTSIPFHRSFLRLLDGSTLNNVTMRGSSTFVWAEGH